MKRVSIDEHILDELRAIRRLLERQDPETQAERAAKRAENALLDNLPDDLREQVIAARLTDYSGWEIAQPPRQVGSHRYPIRQEP